MAERKGGLAALVGSKVKEVREHAAARIEPEQAPASTRAGDSSKARPAADGSKPKWKQLQHKPVRLWPEQLGELTRIARTLTREKGGRGERITENTLIRVAIDLILSREDDLNGTTTEDEIRAALSLLPRE
jgi:hypothetical protein